MRRTGKGGGVYQHDEAHPDAGEIDLAQRGDGCGDVAPEDVDGDLVAEANAHFRRLLGGEAELRRAGVVAAPPRACGEGCACGQRLGIADGAVAFDHPMPWGHLARWTVVDAGNDPAEHRGVVNAADAWVGLQPVEEPRHLVFLQIDEEERRRALGQVPGDGTAQVTVDLPDGSEHREAEAEREHDWGRRAARPADGPERPATSGAGAQTGAKAAGR